MPVGLLVDPGQQRAYKNIRYEVYPTWFSVIWYARCPSHQDRGICPRVETYTNVCTQQESPVLFWDGQDLLLEITQDAESISLWANLIQWLARRLWERTSLKISRLIHCMHGARCTVSIRRETRSVCMGEPSRSPSNRCAPRYSLVPSRSLNFI